MKTLTLQSKPLEKSLKHFLIFFTKKVENWSLYILFPDRNLYVTVHNLAVMRGFEAISLLVEKN